MSVCSICLAEIKERQRTYMHEKYGYLHPFHEECIMGWAYRRTPNVECPDCRHKLGDINKIQSD